jgi:hypothetical protein
VVAAEVEPDAGGPENLAALRHAQLAIDEDVNHRVNLFGRLASDPKQFARSSKSLHSRIKLKDATIHFALRFRLNCRSPGSSATIDLVPFDPVVNCRLRDLDFDSSFGN